MVCLGQLQARGEKRLIHQHGRPIVQEANSNAYASARIAKQMILFTDPVKPLPRAPKGTVIRKRSLEQYAQEISDL